MAEGVQTPDGKPVEVTPANADQVERDFARAMTEPAGDDKAPPRRTERAQEARREAPRVKRGRKPADASAGKPEPSKGLSRSARVEGVKGIVQVVAAGCVFASTRVKNPVPLAADGLVLADGAGSFAEATAEVCEHDPRMAALVDRVASAGPYGALITVGFQLGSQIARNHGLPVPGTTAPEDLIKAVQGDEMPVAA